MKKFKFKFSYFANGVGVKGDGYCKAETREEARTIAKQGVAKDLGGSVEDVNILSVTAVRAKKAAK
jgi:hypothetical protein